jgi:hypothetical protein
MLERALILLEPRVARAEIRERGGAVLLRDCERESHLRELNASLPLAAHQRFGAVGQHHIRSDHGVRARGRGFGGGHPRQQSG